MIEDIEHYYSEKIKTYGPTPQGVDWNSEESQALRFDRLLQVMRSIDNASILDLGCGYGALAKMLGPHVQYTGYDISDSMIEEARKFNLDKPNVEFLQQKPYLPFHQTLLYSLY